MKAQPTRRGSFQKWAGLPAAAILLASLAACSADDVTAPPNGSSYSADDSGTQRADPPFENDGSGGSGTNDQDDQSAVKESAGEDVGLAGSNQPE
jgi:hypothetical protein